MTDATEADFGSAAESLHIRLSTISAKVANPNRARRLCGVLSGNFTPFATHPHFEGITIDRKYPFAREKPLDEMPRTKIVQSRAVTAKAVVKEVVRVNLSEAPRPTADGASARPTTTAAKRDR
jgi:hypothetical protein